MGGKNNRVQQAQVGPEMLPLSVTSWLTLAAFAGGAGIGIVEIWKSQRDQRPILCGGLVMLAVVSLYLAHTLKSILESA